MEENEETKKNRDIENDDDDDDDDDDGDGDDDDDGCCKSTATAAGLPPFVSVSAGFDCFEGGQKIDPGEVGKLCRDSELASQNSTQS